MLGSKNSSESGIFVLSSTIVHTEFYAGRSCLGMMQFQWVLRKQTFSGIVLDRLEVHRGESAVSHRYTADDDHHFSR